MPVQNNSSLLLHFKSFRSDGELFEDTTKGEPQSVVLGQKMINPAFEEALLGKEEGDCVTVTLAPEKAYGKYNKHLVIPIKRSKLKLEKEPEPGSLIPLEVKGKQYVVTVLEVKPSKIVIDANHPLAGETMRYEITVVKILDEK
ncbi:MAG TPA: FKBP-type peptidyl-prolyl cis-trans isomerase [Methanocorpusculum sp.]|nr:FKBP-type peptidyl-prolyl cis-trans isomerase [Methanocorpusculum sp.]